MMAFSAGDQKMNGDSSTMALFPTRDQFVLTYFRQCFSLPDSTIYYIMKNPKTSEVYQKLIQCCKYFFIKNPILVFHCLQTDNDGWTICSKESNDCRYFQFTKTKINVSIKALSRCKVWIQNRFEILSSNSKCASDFINNIYQCDAEIVLFRNQHISLEQFLYYSQHAKFVNLKEVVINSDTYSEMPVEEIVSNIPKIERFFFEYGNASKNVSSDTVAKLLQIPHFKNIREISLEFITEEFDIDAFYKYYKNLSTKITFFFLYHNTLPEEYMKKLEMINMEILEIGLCGQISSAIMYPEQDEAEQDALWELLEISLKYF